MSIASARCRRHGGVSDCSVELIKVVHRKLQPMLRWIESLMNPSGALPRQHIFGAFIYIVHSIFSLFVYFLCCWPSFFVHLTGVKESHKNKISSDTKAI